MDNVLGVLTQPRHLDAISRRVKLLVVDLERATSTARKGGVGVGAAAGVGAGTAAVAAERTPNQDQELQSLFALLPRLDPLLPIIPPLLARLRSLSALHAEALAIAADLRELQSADRAVSEEEGELRAIVAGVQKGITEALGSVAGNWEAVQTRVAALEKRVDALGK
jgi:nuclear migration protein JNM1